MGISAHMNSNFAWIYMKIAPMLFSPAGKMITNKHWNRLLILFKMVFRKAGKSSCRKHEVGYGHGLILASLSSWTLQVQLPATTWVTCTPAPAALVQALALASEAGLGMSGAGAPGTRLAAPLGTCTPGAATTTAGEARPPAPAARTCTTAGAAGNTPLCPRWVMPLPWPSAAAATILQQT